jgi:hypothetical protein
MSAESMSFRKDINDVIALLGEPFTCSRGTKILAHLKGTADKQFLRNIDNGGPSPMSSDARTITIQYSAKYVPELFDVLTDSHKHIYSVVDVNTIRMEDTTICYTLTIT